MDLQKILPKNGPPIDQVFKYSIKSFNNNNVNYKVIFNGSPKQFLSIAEINNFIIDTEKQIWKVE